MKPLFIFLALAGAARAEVVPDLHPTVRIQRRFVEKKHRVAVYAGFAYHGRADYYRSPGLEVAISYHVLESLALDLRGDVFFSSPSAELKELVSRTGYIPDSRPSRAAVMLGVRYSLGYAKMRLGAGHVLHFEPQVFLYGGFHITQGDYAGVGVAPIGEAGIGFLLYATRRVQARLDAGLTVGGEQRTNYVAVVGGLPVLALGVLF
jgi:hypothetical protein